ncbi:MAG: HAMP domain-containing protein, partial [Gemmatimonadetes bacterium]|nr:HAMP domain-containing protein [Gemmatimonadota bacterium]
ARRWPRPGGTAILVVAVLGSLANFAPLSKGIDARRRELVELFALEHTESPSNSRHFLLATTLDQIQASPELAEALGESPSPEHANLAFVLWAQSPLPNVQGGCYLRLLDANGRAFSTFSLGFPPELRAAEGPDQSSPHFRREEIGPDRVDVYSDTIGIGRGERALGRVELSMAYFDDFSRPRGAASSTPALFTNLAAPDEFLRFRREVPDRVDRYRGDLLVSSTDPEGGLGRVVPSIIVQALAGPSVGGRWVERRIGGRLYDVYCVRERDGELTVGYLTFGIERTGWLDAASLLARAGLVTLVLASGMVAFLMAFAWIVPASSSERLSLPALGFRERVIGGFLIVSLLPTVLLGFAGRRLFVDEKRREFQSALEEDLRVAVGLLGRRLSDAARNVASSAEVAGVVEDPGGYQVLSSPASVDGVVLLAANGQILASSRSANLDVAISGAGGALPPGATEFFRRRGAEIYACATVPVTRAESESGRGRGATVLTFQRIDGLLATELERRTGSAVSFFAAGVLAATSKPELYQAEILSDLLEPLAYLKVELEGARRTLLESRVGATSFLSSYAPLPGADGEVVATLATLAPFQGGGLDLEASLILSRIYFLCLAVFTAAIAAAVVLASRLTHPISALTAGAESLRAGALGHQIRTRASGEIARLVRSFNSMSTRLAESEARDRERREYIEAIIRHVGSGVVSFDAEGRVATVNDAAGRILGVDPARLIGHREADTEVGPAFRTLLAAVEPVRRGEREEVVHEVEVAPVAGETSEESTGEDGELRMLRLVATRLVDSEGNAQGAVAVFEDLTDLIRSKKITAWAEMARQVAHEIKNPLTPMKLSAQHLQQAWRDRHPKLEQILMESTDTIIDRCEALRRIAIEFSDYARMPGRHIRREDLADLVREARRLYGDTEERQVRFQVEVGDEKLWTRVDRDEVMRLFINLFENSIQAMPKGGQLEVEAERRNGNAEVRIRDTGQGISPENMRRIFEPSFSTKTGGAGLGLPICKAIMEDYGGTIDISSETGSGTTVTLRFPVDETGVSAAGA